MTVFNIQWIIWMSKHFTSCLGWQLYKMNTKTRYPSINQELVFLSISFVLSLIDMHRSPPPLLDMVNFTNYSNLEVWEHIGFWILLCLITSFGQCLKIPTSAKYNKITQPSKFRKGKSSISSFGSLWYLFFCSSTFYSLPPNIQQEDRGQPITKDQ